MAIGLAPGVPPSAHFARRLAENGCRVLVPLLIDRSSTFSGIPRFRMTNQPHREFIYRAAFELGRHLIGYEVQKVLAAVDWFATHAGTRPVGVIGYGEGGLLALYSAAADPRLNATAVCGYFQPREDLFTEPIYRNVFSLLEQFGDAELASLVAPRALCIETCDHPAIDAPPPPSEGRQGAAPGIIRTPSFAAVEAELTRAQDLIATLKPAPSFTLTQAADGLPGSDALLTSFLLNLGMKKKLAPLKKMPTSYLKNFDPQTRLQRQFAQLLEHTQGVMRQTEFSRRQFWSEADASNLASWEKSSKTYRRRFWEEIIGKLPKPRMAAKPRTRQIYDEPTYRGYEVVLDVYEDVFAYGILLVPKRIKRNERRPLVVCQHGLEGRPQNVADPAVDNPSYHRYACRLAERGFIVYAPQNPYIGQDDFRVLQRLANPLKLSLFSFIISQHQRTLEWLASQPFVDPARRAFYGLSYGGKTAMRVPAVLEEYCLSICSADYNEWIWKNSSASHAHSYLTTGEYEMFEFNLANTFNYAEMSWLICPRPFMVERGHHDGVAPDEWVAYEFARTYRHYVQLGIGQRAAIEFFDGPHTINGEGTFRFLEQHLDWKGKTGS
jgi:dienelactone hydrolase